MSNPKLIVLILFLHPLCSVTAQTDSVFALSQNLAQKYLSQTSNKIDRYTKRVTSKTEKTLTKLCKWESKIQKVLEKANPEAAKRIFSNHSMSFKRMLDEYKKGESQFQNYKAGYDKYRDDLTTQIKFIDSNKNFITQKAANALSIAKSKASELETEENRNEILQKMIKERRQQLINEAIKHLGKNKYLQKINKEGWYYTETIKNYKQIFEEPGKAEETAKNILNKIPAFTKFMRNNSMLASLFSMRNDPSGGNPQSLVGLQTRVGINTIIQSRVSAGGPNALAEMQQNMQNAHAELNKLKDKLLKGGGTSDTELPDFKPNTQKTKTFLQRVEYGFNMQFGKNNGWMPGTADLAITTGYKLNDKSVIGIGLSYKLGMGSIEKISFSHQGIGVRSYIDWKLKKQFFVSGGYELNHNAGFKNITALQNSEAWQQSGLVGISKKMSLKTKYTKGTKLQLMYDVLHRQHVPVSQPWIFRIGYDLK
ncbi:MAG TPA: hypothetical protein PKU77_00850 [Ferruginibacter sp.]|nr:hypothetical protein [Ferruginibacter sp.]